MSTSPSLPAGSEQPRRGLAEEAAVLCAVICGPGASVPVLETRSAWTAARGLLGEYTVGTEYRPAERGRPATIVVPRAVLGEPELARVALAHELVHHWEHRLEGPGDGPSGYPPEIEALVLRFIPDRLRARRWRERHTPRFAANALAVSDRLHVPLAALLFRLPPSASAAPAALGRPR